MRGKKITRQLSKFLETDDFDRDLGELTALLEEKQVLPPKPELLSGMGELMDAVEKAYEQADKMLSIANHSLYLSSEELNQTNKNLRQTHNLIRDMLNSLPEGFLILDRNGVCTSLVSLKAHELLATNPEGKPLAEILGVAAGADVDSLKDWYSFLFEEKIPFEELSVLGPDRFRHPDPNRHVHLQFKPIRDDEGKLHSVVLVAVDMTAEIEARRQAEQMRHRSEMILHRHQNPQGFFRCLQLVEETIGTVRKATGFDEVPRATLEEVERALHTLKGTLGMFSVADLQALAHSIEDRIRQERENGVVTGQLLEKLIEELQGAYFTFRDENLETLSLDDNRPETRPLSVAGIENFLSWLGRRADGAELVARFREEILREPLRNLLEPLGDRASQIAGHMGKQVACEVDCPPDLKVDPKFFEGFFEVLVHLVSNAVDHGLELPEERVSRGKPLSGTLLFSARRREDLLTLRIQDDGRGIDLVRVREKSSRLGLIPEFADDQQVLMSIFAHGFSTKDNVTEISGRGVGLDAVKAWIDAAGGTIRVVSVPDEGTLFEMTIPLQDAASSARAA